MIELTVLLDDLNKEQDIKNSCTNDMLSILDKLESLNYGLYKVIDNHCIKME